MSRETTKKRLDKLCMRKTTHEKPTHNIQETIALFTELAADGVISAETMAAVRTRHVKEDIFGCCATKELHALSYLLDTERREEYRKRAHDPLWRNLRDLDIEELERLDGLIRQYQ